MINEYIVITYYDKLICFIKIAYKKITYWICLNYNFVFMSLNVAAIDNNFYLLNNLTLAESWK